MKKVFTVFSFIFLFPLVVMAGEGADDFTIRMSQEFYETPLKGELLSVNDAETLILDLLKKEGSGVSLLEDIPEVRQILGDRLLDSLSAYFDDSVSLDGFILLGLLGVFQERHALIDNFSFSLPEKYGVVPAEVSSLNLYVHADPPLSMDYSSMHGELWFDYSVRNQKVPSCFVSFCAGVFDLSLQCSFHVVDGSTYIIVESSATDLVVLDTAQGSVKVILETEYSGRTPIGSNEGSSDLRVNYDILDALGNIVHSGTYIAQQNLGFNYFGTLGTSFSSSLGVAP